MKRVPFQPAWLAAVGLLACLAPTTALANSIPSGTGTIGGTVDIYANPACSPTCASGIGIYFYNTAATVPQGYDAGTASGSFSGLTNGTGTMAGGQLLNLLGTPQTGVLGSPIVDEATFVTTLGLIQFNATNIPAGTGTNAACASNLIGNVCTPTGSPFTLTQNGLNASSMSTVGTLCTQDCTVGISLSVDGVAYIINSTNADPTSGLFTASESALGTLTSVLAAVASSSGLTDQTFSATFTATAVTTPEPEALYLVLGGLALIAFGRRSWLARN
jgi:hypothetical protein